MATFFHRTTRKTAAKILATGFRDGKGSYLTTGVHEGVWISNVPLDENEGASGDTLLEVVIDGRVIAKYEWVEEGKPHREWMVPAALLNKRAKVRRVEEDDDAAATMSPEQTHQLLAEKLGRRKGVK